MNKADINEPIRKTFHSKEGQTIEFYQRELPLVEAEIVLDLKPFFELPSLLQFSDFDKKLIVLKGRLEKVIFESKNSYSLFFIDEHVHVTKEFNLPEVKFSLLSVWRVNGYLDALQVSISSKKEKLYIQTGGAGLLNLFNSSNFSDDLALNNVLDLFNKPILT